MSDLVERLRKEQKKWESLGKAPIQGEAADRIEELEDLYEGACASEEMYINSIKTQLITIKELESDDRIDLCVTQAKKIVAQDKRIKELKFTVKNLREEATMQIASSVKAFDRNKELENKIDNANMAASETHRDWKSRCYAIMSALGEDYAEDNDNGRL